MAADLSQVRFDARRDHSGVHLQQGKLLLDADWNEFRDLLDRRLRAMAADLGSEGPVPGVPGVAAVPATTPHSFEPTYVPPSATAPADLGIGHGRMYVDGLLAENHGLTPGGLLESALDPVLRDPREAHPYSYLEQPYLSAPPPLPTAGRHLVYLDVWEREVTAAVDARLIEPAVGVDTTTRTQIVWQVRVHEPDAPALVPSSTDGEIPGWMPVVLPSSGRLSSYTLMQWSDGSDEACILPPASGYRGVENQLYRVEIHDAGRIGTATFKWSRDNASVVIPIREVVDGRHIRPASLGPDDVRGLDVGQWIEILDDRAELAGRPGVLRRIAAPADDRGVVLLDAPLPDVYAGPTAPHPLKHHLRLIRWDQAGPVRDESGEEITTVEDGLGTIATSNQAIQLERGIVVSFGVQQDFGAPPDVQTHVEFRTGDHWVFAARVATGDIERLDQAPPRGIQHHMARLAILDAVTGELIHLRRQWPPEAGACGCTVCVTPESHALGFLTIQQAVDSVLPTGGTVCLHAGMYAVRQPIRIAGHVAGVRVHGHTPGVRLLADGDAIVMSGCDGVELADFEVIAPGGAAVDVGQSSDVTLRHLDVRGAPGNPESIGIKLQEHLLRVSIVDCAIIAETGICDVPAPGNPLETTDLVVRDNLIVGGDVGIRFDGTPLHLLGFTIERNRVRSERGDGLRLVGLILDGDTAADVVGNAVEARSGSGIVVGPGGYRVAANTVVSWMNPNGLAAIAVSVGLVPDSRGHTVIDGNRVSGGNHGIRVVAPVTSFVAVDNTVDGATERGIFVEAPTVHATVTGNTVRRTTGATGTSAGIEVVGATHVAIRDNIVSELAIEPVRGSTSNGIRVAACAESQVTGNLVEGFGADATTCTGILVNAVAGVSRIESNVVRRQLQADTTGYLNSIAQWTGIRIEDPDERFIVLPSPIPGRPPIVIARPQNTAHDVLITGNVATGGTRAFACFIDSKAGEAIVSNNRFLGATDTLEPVLWVEARAATVQGNRVFGGGPAAVNVAVNPAAIAVLGNLTGQPITVAGAPLAGPWAALNVTGVVL